MAVGLYPGSFDPFHVGHLSVVEQGSAFFDELVVAVLGNPSKRGFLPIATRVLLIEAATAHLDNVRCVTHDGLTVDAARREGADLIVRALGKEAAGEYEMAATNRLISGIPTVFVSAGPATSAVSSTFIRDLVANGHHDKLDGLVPDIVVTKLRRALPPISVLDGRDR